MNCINITSTVFGSQTAVFGHIKGVNQLNGNFHFIINLHKHKVDHEFIRNWSERNTLGLFNPLADVNNYQIVIGHSYNTLAIYRIKEIRQPLSLNADYLYHDTSIVSNNLCVMELHGCYADVLLKHHISRSWAHNILILINVCL